MEPVPPERAAALGARAPLPNDGKEGGDGDALSVGQGIMGQR